MNNIQSYILEKLKNNKFNASINESGFIEVQDYGIIKIDFQAVNWSISCEPSGENDLFEWIKDITPEGTNHYEGESRKEFDNSVEKLIHLMFELHNMFADAVSE